MIVSNSQKRIKDASVSIGSSQYQSAATPLQNKNASPIQAIKASSSMLLSSITEQHSPNKQFRAQTQQQKSHQAEPRIKKQLRQNSTHKIYYQTNRQTSDEREPESPGLKVTRNGFGMASNTGSHGVMLAQKHRNSSAVIQQNNDEGVSHMPYSIMKQHIKGNASSILQFEADTSTPAYATPAPQKKRRLARIGSAKVQYQGQRRESVNTSNRLNEINNQKHIILQQLSVKLGYQRQPSPESSAANTSGYKNKARRLRQNLSIQESQYPISQVSTQVGLASRPSTAAIKHGQSRQKQVGEPHPYHGTAGSKRMAGRTLMSNQDSISIAIDNQSQSIRNLDNQSMNQASEYPNQSQALLKNQSPQPAINNKQRPLTAKRIKKKSSQVSLSKSISKKPNHLLLNNASSFITPDAATPDLSPIKPRFTTPLQSHHAPLFQDQQQEQLVDIESKLQHHMSKISVKRNLTDHMYAQNTHCEQIIHHIDKLNEDKQMENEVAFKQYSGQNPRGLLQQMFRDIKGMNYQLNQIVANEGEFHQMLIPRKLTEIEVLEGSPMYFKIPVKDGNSPLKFQFSYRQSDYLKGRKTDLWAFFSFLNKVPSNKDNYKSAFNPKGQFRIAQVGGDNKFTSDYLYICLSSQSGNSVDLDFQFSEDENFLAAAIKNDQGGAGTRRSNNDISLNLDSNQVLKEGESGFGPYWDKALKEFDDLKKNQKDCISKNMNHFPKPLENDINRAIRAQELQIRIVDAHERRQLQNHEDFKLKYFLVHRWSIIKERKRQYIIKFQEIQRQREIKRAWYKLMLTKQVLGKVFDKFHEQRLLVYLMRKRRVSALKIARSFVNKVLKPMGQTEEERYTKKIRDSLSFVVLGMRDRKEEKAKEIMLSFLRDTKNIFDMKVKLARYQKYIGQVQRQIKVFFVNYQKRIEAIGEIWEMIKGDMIKEGLGKKAPKKKQQLVPKLTSLNEEIKNKVIRMYLHRQILRHQFLVLEYLFRKQYSGQQDSIQKEVHITKCLAMRDEFMEIDSLIFKGVEFEHEPYIQSCNIQHFVFKSGQTDQGKGKADGKGMQSPTKVGKTPIAGKAGSTAKTPGGKGGDSKETKNISFKSATASQNKTYPFFKFIPKEEILRDLIKKSATYESTSELDIQFMRKKAEEAKAASSPTKKKA